MRQRYYFGGFGCFCKKSRIQDFKRKKLEELKSNSGFKEILLKKNKKSRLGSQLVSGSKGLSSLMGRPSESLKAPLIPDFSKTVLFIKKRKEVMLEYIKYILGVEKLEETSVMVNVKDIETTLFTSLLTQFAYINFFIPYCLYIGLVASIVNLGVISLMIGYYRYFSKKSVSKRIKDIDIWISVFRIVSCIGKNQTLKKIRCCVQRVHFVQKEENCLEKFV